MIVAPPGVRICETEALANRGIGPPWILTGAGCPCIDGRACVIIRTCVEPPIVVNVGTTGRTCA